MFLVTSIAMLRERTTGTLERLMTMPLGKVDLLAGYALAFGARSPSSRRAGLLRSRSALLGLDVAGPALAGRSRWRSRTRCSAWRSACSSARSRGPSSRPCSSCRRSCFPQLLLCGLFVARDEMAAGFARSRGAAADLRLRRARPHRGGNFDARFVLNVAVVCGCVVLAIVLGGATLRRRTG